MSDARDPRRDGAVDAVDAEFLRRNHEVGLELIRDSHDADSMMDRVIDEFEGRLAELSADALDARTGPPSERDRGRIRALAMLAGQVAALLEKSAATEKLRRWAEEQQRLNLELQRAWSREHDARTRTERAIDALAIGLLWVDGDGRILEGNRTFANWVGLAEDELRGLRVSSFVGAVPRGGDGRVRIEVRDGPRSTGVGGFGGGPEGGPEGGDVALDESSPLEFEVRRRAWDDERGGEVVSVRRAGEAPDGSGDRLAARADELESLGMVCHRINNPLTSLLGRAQILNHRKDLPEAARGGVGVIEESARRIAEDVRELQLRLRTLRREARQLAAVRDEADDAADGDAGRV